MADTRLRGNLATKRRTVNPIEELTLTPAMQTRQRVLAWFARMHNELHAVSDALNAGQFGDAFSDTETDKLNLALDNAWQVLAIARPQTIPPELTDDIKEFVDQK